jgi:hypothetical protein
MRSLPSAGGADQLRGGVRQSDRRAHRAGCGPHHPGGKVDEAPRPRQPGGVTADSQSWSDCHKRGQRGELTGDAWVVLNDFDRRPIADRISTAPNARVIRRRPGPMVPDCITFLRRSRALCGLRLHRRGVPAKGRDNRPGNGPGGANFGAIFSPTVQGCQAIRRGSTCRSAPSSDVERKAVSDITYLVIFAGYPRGYGRRRGVRSMLSSTRVQDS